MFHNFYSPTGTSETLDENVIFIDDSTNDSMFHFQPPNNSQSSNIQLPQTNQSPMIIQHNNQSSQTNPQNNLLQNNNQLQNNQLQNNQLQNNNPQNNSPQNNSPSFEYDRYFVLWMINQNVSFVLSSYKNNRIMSIGNLLNPNTSEYIISVWLTPFSRPMGIHINSNNQIYISSSNNICQFNNNGQLNQKQAGIFDANFVPKQAHFTPDLDVHDIGTDINNNLYFCSAKFSCICTTSNSHSFKVYWKPPWISRILPEDRCHLNGLCFREGIPRYVTSFSKSNIANGWRTSQNNKGIVFDIVNDTIVCEGLSLPHSPKWFANKLWILESGSGHLGYIENNIFIKKMWFPGFLRGLKFINERYAIVTTSQDRHNSSFNLLPLYNELLKNGVESPISGIHIIDLNNFSVPHFVMFNSPDSEFYDIDVLHNVSRPCLFNINNIDFSVLSNYNIDYGNYNDNIK